LALPDWNENVDRPYTSLREIDVRNPRRKSSMPFRYAKTSVYKDHTWNTWMQNLYK